MLCIGLTMAVWSSCPLKCPPWGQGELGALQSLLSIQHGQRGASQEVGSIAADALLPRMRADVGQVTEEVVSRAVGRQEEREDITQAEGAICTSVWAIRGCWGLSHIRVCFISWTKSAKQLGCVEVVPAEPGGFSHMLRGVC